VIDLIRSIEVLVRDRYSLSVCDSFSNDEPR
jgi:hypothetical protein